MQDNERGYALGPEGLTKFVYVSQQKQQQQRKQTLPHPFPNSPTPPTKEHPLQRGVKGNHKGWEALEAARR